VGFRRQTAGKGILGTQQKQSASPGCTAEVLGYLLSRGGTAELRSCSQASSLHSPFPCSQALPESRLSCNCFTPRMRLETALTSGGKYRPAWPGGEGLKRETWEAGREVFSPDPPSVCLFSLRGPSGT
jgi:hypothetical protein